MGNNYLKQAKSKEEPKMIKDYQKIIENLNKRNLNDPSDFSLEKIKQKALILFQESKVINSYKEKILKLEEAISNDNTNENILKEYLILLKGNDQEKYEIKLKLYYYHISPKSYMEISGIKKKLSSIDLLIEILNQFKSFEAFEDLGQECKLKYDFTRYFYFTKNKNISLSTNSTFTVKSNLELCLFELCSSLYREVNRKIDKIWKICADKQKTFQEKATLVLTIEDFEVVKNLKDKMDDSILLFFKSQLYSEIFPDIKKYISELDEIIKKCLEFKDIETDFYILLFIIYNIKYTISYNENFTKYIDKIKEYKNDNINNNNKNGFQINNKDAIINEKIVIKDYYKYDMKSILAYLKKHNNKWNNFALTKFIKLQYFNSNNYIIIMKEFIDSFNNNISSSKTIATLLYELYPELKDKKLFESSFIEEIFKMALNNCYYYPFKGNIGAVTFDESGTILFFIPNRTNLKMYELNLLPKKATYMIINLGVFIYLEFHEILGHFLRIILSKIIDYKYISPHSNISEKNEFGECIEYYLFGKRFLNFTIKQLIYLLDFNNYKKHYLEFRKEFLNIDSMRYLPSKGFIELCSKIGVNINVIDNDIKDVGSLLKEKNIFEDLIVNVPFYNNCNDNYELCQDETLINFLKSGNI